MQSKIEKQPFLFEIKAFKVVVKKSAYSDGNTLSSGVNVLTNSLKISDATKEDIFQLNLCRIGGKIGKWRCRAEFTSVSNPLKRWLPNVVLKQDLLDA